MQLSKQAYLFTFSAFNFKNQLDALTDALRTTYDIFLSDTKSLRAVRKIIFPECADG
jgi:hypothetical protein